MEIEKKIEGMNRTDKMNFLKSLSPAERVLYDKYKNNQRQKRYKEDKDNKKKANERSKKIMQDNRKENPDKYKKMNIIHNRTYNAKKPKAQAKAKEQAKNDVMDILNDIISSVPQIVKNKKNSQAVAKHKAKKQAGEARTYMTRSKSRTLNLF
jgi:hypothetical protein